jgi:hypothetical protein
MVAKVVLVVVLRRTEPVELLGQTPHHLVGQVTKILEHPHQVQVNPVVVVPEEQVQLAKVASV